MKVGKISSLNVKLKNDKSKTWQLMTVKWEQRVLKCDKCEVPLLSTDAQQIIAILDLKH